MPAPGLMTSDVLVTNRDTGISEPLTTGYDVEQDFYNTVYDHTNSSVYNDRDVDVDVEAESDLINDILAGTGANVSLSEFMRNNPGLNAEDYYKFMAQHSDEWAEKYVDYLMEKQSLKENNEYSANREDTAYQRLTNDLKAAGLNPALLYGSSASPQVSNSLGYLKQSEGANSRSVGNFNKLKQLMLAFMSYELYRELDTVDTVSKTAKNFTSIFKDIASIAALF